MMSPLRLRLAVVLVVLALAGCAGRDFTRAAPESLQLGKTTYAEIIARLEHPNILPIFDYGEQGTTPYLVMPLIGGGTLLDWDPGPLGSALPVISRTLSALEYAHAQHVIHRDIKPTNILMHHGEWPLIADFGLAQIIDARRHVTESEYSIGTPGFMPPEQILGQEIDHRADLYAMGVILFAEGRMFWGRLYLIGLGCFVLALVMRLRLEWAPLLFGGLYALAILYMGYHGRRAAAAAHVRLK